MQFLAVFWRKIKVFHRFWGYKMRQKTGRFRLQTFLKVSGRKLFENGIPATRSKIDLELLMRAPWNRLVTLFTVVYLVFNLDWFLRYFFSPFSKITFQSPQKLKTRFFDKKIDKNREKSFFLLFFADNFWWRFRRAIIRCSSSIKT